MTGFGRHIATWGDKKITVEVKSLNSKMLDLNARISSWYRDQEALMRQRVARAAERGKVDVLLVVEQESEAPRVTLNKPLAAAYYKQLKDFAREVHEADTPILPTVLGLPEVLRSERQEVTTEELEAVYGILDAALQAFDAFRKTEGALLQEELLGRVQRIQHHLHEIIGMDGKRQQNVKERIRKHLEEHLGKVSIDQNRFEQEMIYYLEKMDITEEKVRLDTHCRYFLNTMLEDQAGRKLGFIAQEIGREINTIGSKANDAEMQQTVVLMKDELEKVKEQLLNIL
jgi:uncharacterized protein (TIGR00255 family)